MRKILLFIGIIVILIGLIPLMSYALDYTELSSYGKGYVWGKIIIVFFGALMIIFSRRLKK